MIRLSKVALIITLEDSEGTEVTSHLGISPTEISKNQIQHNRGDDTFETKIHYSWVLSSPDSTSDPATRLNALVDILTPISERIISLDPQYRRWVDILYHVTAQNPHGISGEFDWLQMPAPIMKKLGSWNLDLSYEVFWFDHPDWRKTWIQKLLRR